jgi:uncharacterized protein (DUF736 family)
MAYEQKDNSGSLFREAEKKSERSPDYTGKAMIDGKMKRIAGWIKQTSAGGNFLSLSITDPQPPKAEAPARSADKAAPDYDGIPF